MPSNAGLIVRRASFLAFPVAFGCLLGLYILVVWSNPVPPLQDLGSHIEMMDVASRLSQSTGAAGDASDLFTSPDRPLPNTLSIGVAWLFGDIMDIAFMAKLLVTFYVLGFPLALLWLCRVLGRPRWWVFLAAPLTINPMLTLGLLNYLLALPLIVLGVGLAVRWARDGNRWCGALLAVNLVAAAFAHMIGYTFVALLVGILLLLYLRRPRDLLRFGVFIPSFIPGLGFASVLAKAPSSGESGLAWSPLQTSISDWWADSFDTYAGRMDDWVGVGVIVIAMMFLVQAHLFADPASARTQPGTPGPSVLERLRANPLVLLAVFSVALYLVLPHALGDVWIRFRWPVILISLLLLVPEYRRTRFTHALVGIAVALALGAGGLAAANFNAAAQRYDGLIAALDSLPQGSWLATPTPGLEVDPIFNDHVERAVRGLNGWLNGGLSSHSFMSKYYTPIKFRDGAAPPNPATLLAPQIFDYDYGLVRSFLTPKRLLKAPHLRLQWSGDNWWLFRVVDPKPPRIVVMTSGHLGSPARVACPTDSAVVGLGLSFDRDGLRGLRPRCVQLSTLHRVVGEPQPMKQLGTANPLGAIDRIDCARGEVVVGLVGAEGMAIRRLGIVCEQVQTALAGDPKRKARVTVRVAGKSQTWPPPLPVPTFSLRCPPETIAVGFRGRAGSRMEAVGLACDALAPMQLTGPR